MDNIFDLFNARKESMDMVPVNESTSVNLENEEVFEDDYFVSEAFVLDTLVVLESIIEGYEEEIEECASLTESMSYQDEMEEMKVLEEGIKDAIKAAGGKVKAGATKVKDGAKAAPGKARDAYKSLFLKFKNANKLRKLIEKDQALLEKIDGILASREEVDETKIKRIVGTAALFVAAGGPLGLIPSSIIGNRSMKKGEGKLSGTRRLKKFRASLASTIRLANKRLEKLEGGVAEEAPAQETFKLTFKEAQELVSFAIECYEAELEECVSITESMSLEDELEELKTLQEGIISKIDGAVDKLHEKLHKFMAKYKHPHELRKEIEKNEDVLHHIESNLATKEEVPDSIVKKLLRAASFLAILTPGPTGFLAIGARKVSGERGKGNLVGKRMLIRAKANLDIAIRVAKKRLAEIEGVDAAAQESMEIEDLDVMEEAVREKFNEYRKARKMNKARKRLAKAQKKVEKYQGMLNDPANEEDQDIIKEELDFLLEDIEDLRYEMEEIEEGSSLQETWTDEELEALEEGLKQKFNEYKNASIKKKIEKKQKELDLAKVKLEEEEDEKKRETIEYGINKLNAAIEKLQGKLKEVDEVPGELVAESFEELEMIEEGLKEKFKEYKAARGIVKIKRQIKKAEKEVAKLEKQLEDPKKDYMKDEIQGKLDAAKAKVEELRGQLPQEGVQESLALEAFIVEDDMDVLEEGLKQKAREFRKARIIAKKKKSIAKKEKQIAKLKEKIESGKKEHLHDGYRKDIETYEEQIEELKEELAELQQVPVDEGFKQKVADIKAKSREKRLVKKIAKKEKQIAKAKNEEKKAKLENELASLKGKLDEMRQEPFESVEEAVAKLETIMQESTNGMIEYQAACYMENLVLEHMMYTDFDEKRIQATLEATMRERAEGLIQRIQGLWKRIKAWFANLKENISNFFKNGEELYNQYGETAIRDALKSCDVEVKMPRYMDPLTAIGQLRGKLIGVNFAGATQITNQGVLDKVGIHDFKEIDNQVKYLFITSSGEGGTRKISSLNPKVVGRYLTGTEAASQLTALQTEMDKDFNSMLSAIKTTTERGEDIDGHVKVFQFAINLKNRAIQVALNMLKRGNSDMTKIVRKALSKRGAVKESFEFDEIEFMDEKPVKESSIFDDIEFDD